MWWLFTKNENPVIALERSKTSLDILTRRFERKELSNEDYLNKALKIQKDIAKYEKKIAKLEQN